MVAYLPLGVLSFAGKSLTILRRFKSVPALVPPMIFVSFFIDSITLRGIQWIDSLVIFFFGTKAYPSALVVLNAVSPLPSRTGS
jgi:hypothetical protein